MNANISSSESLSTHRTEYPAIYDLGARGAQTAAPWSSLNPTGTSYDLTMLTHPDFGLAALKSYGFTTIFLNIPVVAITKRRMPSDISSLAFNDSAVKTRLRQLVDQVLPHLNESVKYVAFGNEVDLYFVTHSTEWSAYIELVQDARSYLKNLRSTIQVGVTTTFAGAHGSQAAQVKQLNTAMDIVPLTYYPIDSSTFVPRDASTLSADFTAMLSLAMQSSGFHPLFNVHIGYDYELTSYLGAGVYFDTTYRLQSIMVDLGNGRKSYSNNAFIFQPAFLIGYRF